MAIICDANRVGIAGEVLASSFSLGEPPASPTFVLGL